MAVFLLLQKQQRFVQLSRLFLESFVYKKLKIRNTSDMLRSTASSIGSIFMMIFFCLLLSQAMTRLMIPQKLVEVFLGFTDNKYVVLLMVNVFLLLWE